MTVTTSRRGRPKGTGIDDRALLIEIAEMIAADPAMKPTTAIRALGIEDPSIIRRLRDKYNEHAKAECEVTSIPERKRIRAANDDERSSTICLERMRDSRLMRTAAVPTANQPPAPVASLLNPTSPAPLDEPQGCLLTAEDTPPQSSPAVAAVAPEPVQTSAAPAHDMTAEDATRALASLVSAGLRASASTIKAQVMFGAQLMHSPPAIAAMRFQLAWNAYFIALCRPQSAESAI